MADLFISHAAEDRELALQIKGHVEQDNRYSAWAYEVDSRGFGNFEERVQKEVSGCGAFLVIISKAALESEHVWVELEQASREKKFMLPVLLGVSHDRLKSEHNDWTTAIGLHLAEPVEDGKRQQLHEKVLEALKNQVAERKSEPVPAKTEEQSRTRTRYSRTYKIFVHYVPPAEIRKDLQDDAASENTWNRIRSDLCRIYRRLDRITKPKGDWKGRAFVFLEPGWIDVFSGGLSVDLTEQLGKTHQHLKDKGLIGGRDGNRLVTATVMHKVLTVARQGMPSETHTLLKRFLVGGEQKLFYDAPKVAEALVRIANIGHNVPVFRFDADVLLESGPNEDQDIDGSRDSILRLCGHFDWLTGDPNIGYFLFSGGYIPAYERKHFRARTLSLTEYQKWALDGFAVRTLQLCTLSESDLRERKISLSEDNVDKFLSGLWQVGSHPYRQVVSGAGLCMSDGAILDLPPFSNMRQNVVWVDDHLKYALHHELKHFGYEYGTQQVACVEGAWFRQIRHRPAPSWNDIRHHLSEYLPRLVLGCIADSFLRQTSQLKLSFPFKDDFEKAMEKSPGKYAKKFMRHAQYKLTEDEIQELGEELWKLAIARLNEITKFFEGFSDTFLGCFVTGKGMQELFAYNEDVNGDVDRWKPPAMAKRGLAAEVKALESAKDLSFRLLAAEQSPSEPAGLAGLSLRDAIVTLIEDFLDYMQFARFWGDLVFAVRQQLNQAHSVNTEALDIV